MRAARCAAGGSVANHGPFTQEQIVSEANVSANYSALADPAISETELDRASGGFFPFVALGVALGIAYCIADGTLDRLRPQRAIFRRDPRTSDEEAGFV
jgi:hypothetical protein